MNSQHLIETLNKMKSMILIFYRNRLVMAISNIAQYINPSHSGGTSYNTQYVVLLAPGLYFIDTLIFHISSSLPTLKQF